MADPLAGQPFQLINYGGKRGTSWYRNPASIDEMQAHCDSHNHIWVLTHNGDAKQVKVNGAVRRWKRDGSRIAVPYKYGLYEYGTLTGTDLGMVLIPCDPPSGNAPVLSTSEPGTLSSTIGGKKL